MSKPIPRAEVLLPHGVVEAFRATATRLQQADPQQSPYGSSDPQGAASDNQWDMDINACEMCFCVE